MKINSLVFTDDSTNHMGQMQYIQAVVDTWGPQGEDLHDGRIYITYFVNQDSDDVIHANCPRLGKHAEVNSFEEGKQLCNTWNTEYWTGLIEHIHKYIFAQTLSPDESDENLLAASILVETQKNGKNKFQWVIRNKDDQAILDGEAFAIDVALDVAKRNYRDLYGVSDFFFNN